MAAVSRVVLLGRHGIPRVTSSVYISKREKSEITQANYKRGRGGRSSFSGTVATVFGASGFVGRYIVNKLGKTGSQVIIPYRGTEYDIKRFKLCGDLGQILFFPYHLEDEESIRKVMQYSNVVINLVGRDWETKNFDFKKVHTDGARRIARIAKESGVEKFIHFSSLNVSPNPKKLVLRPSRFLISKYEGEMAVREEFPEAIIFRPADIFGLEDRFVNYFLSAFRRVRVSSLPLYKKGEKTIKQPVYVGDVAEGVIQALRNPATVGKVVDAVGPSRYYLSDLMDYMYALTRRKEYKRIRLTPGIILRSYLMKFSPYDPKCCIPKLEKEFLTDTMEGDLILEDLGVQLVNTLDRIAFCCKPYLTTAHYEEILGEFAPVPKPAMADTSDTNSRFVVNLTK
ncbi:hypothetical protein CHS0354_020161 [Potamilus streckersoni]|uniref:NADH dehydrogenase [ubiquinone] 1 alpha subcomplex subunit 9, mitochondrial n=1 Tax=Potamilus streckersoni TaxID=2493646 RepID=A0AAE0S4Y2_9BIVA|nr:hypothetical protein CHS0354_020161 [Potamilus streckersoni]